MKAENFIIADAKEAQSYGFTIEGDVCFIFEIDYYTAACLGQTKNDQGISVWRLDTIDSELTPYSRVLDTLEDGLILGQAIAKAGAALGSAGELDNRNFGAMLQMFGMV
jgi:hypothetical protein